MRIKFKILVLFLEYEQDKYKGTFAKLKSYMDNVSFCEKTYVVIDNRQPDSPWRGVENVYYMGGDNSFREFSGWQKGLDEVHARGISYDIILVCNNSFLVNGRSFLDKISVWNLLKVLFMKAVLGRIDSSQESMTIRQYQFSDWICTNSFFLSKNSIKALGGKLISLEKDNLEVFCPKTFKPYKKIICKYVVRSEQLNGNRFTVKADLPAHKKFECQIQLNKNFIPSEHGMGDDNRELGVLIRGVTLNGVSLELAELSKGGYGVENNTLWMGKTVNLSLETGERGEILVDCFIHREIFDNVYEGDLEFSFFDVRSIFKKDAPISKNYQMFILDWLTHNWHSKYEITEENWGLTREKISCLLNEVLLSCRLREAGVKLLGAKL